MRICAELTLRRIGAQYMLVQETRDGTGSTNVYCMNSTAAYLWECIGASDVNETQLVEWLCERYDVDEAVAISDVRKILAEWQRIGIVC